MGASYLEELDYRGFRGDIREAVFEVLDELRWKIRSEGRDYVEASVGMGLLSWVENISIDFVGGNRLEVRSKCAMPMQMIDWGKNKSNVRKFLNILEDILDEYE